MLLPASKTVGQILTQDGGFQRFTAALQQAGQLEQLQAATGQFTVFAPSDSALARLDSALQERLMSGSSCAADILKHHILPNVICSGIIEGKTKTKNLLDKFLTMERMDDGEVMVEGVKLTMMKDIVGTNGVIHVLEEVLVPKSARSLVDVLEERESGNLLDLVQEADLLASIAGMPNLTLFLPTEKALAKLPKAFLQELRSDQTKLKEFLMYHISKSGKKCSKCEFENDMMLHTGVDNHEVCIKCIYI